MRQNPNQLEFVFERPEHGLVSSTKCEHIFYTDEFTEHEVCEKCGLCVPHSYILENCNLADWPEDDL